MQVFDIFHGTAIPEEHMGALQSFKNYLFIIHLQFIDTVWQVSDSSLST